MFAPAALITGIPVFSIIIRYNLLENKICGPLPANLFAVVLPWVLALFFFAGSLLNNLIQWSSALLFVELNLLLPMLLYVRISKHRGLLDAHPRIALPGYRRGDRAVDDAG